MDDIKEGGIDEEDDKGKTIGAGNVRHLNEREV